MQPESAATETDTDMLRYVLPQQSIALLQFVYVKRVWERAVLQH